MPFYAITVNREDPQIEEKLKLWKDCLENDKKMLATFSFHHPQPTSKLLELMIYEAEYFDASQLNEIIHAFKPAEVLDSSLALYFSNSLNNYTHHETRSNQSQKPAKDFTFFLPYLLTLYKALITSKTDEVINHFLYDEQFRKNLPVQKKAWSRKITLPSTSCIISLTLNLCRDGGMKPNIYNYFTFHETLNETTVGTYDHNTNQFYFAKPKGEAGGLAVIENQDNGSLSELLTGAVSVEEE